MPLLTNGFNATADRLQHWGDHHVDFEPPPITEEEYEAKADAFLGGACPPHVLRCVRLTQSGRREWRYDPATNEFGVFAVTDRYVISYFKPDPAIHGHSTNEAYFRSNC